MIKQAAAILGQGGLVIYPTETFYALGADYSNAEAIDRLLRLKGRGPQHPLPLIIGNATEVANYCEPNYAFTRIQRLLDEFWPGPLTLILPARATLHAALLSPAINADSAPGVGLRVSSHKMARGLAEMLGRGIISTSANLTGQPPAARLEDLDPQLLAQADMIVDGGPCPGHSPSTILDVRPRHPRLIRQGALNLPDWCWHI